MFYSFFKSFVMRSDSSFVMQLTDRQDGIAFTEIVMNATSLFMTY